MNEKEVVLLPGILQDIDLFVQRGGFTDDVHTDQSSQSLVHG